MGVALESAARIVFGGGGRRSDLIEAGPAGRAKRLSRSGLLAGRSIGGAAVQAMAAAAAEDKLEAAGDVQRLGVLSVAARRRMPEIGSEAARVCLLSPRPAGRPLVKPSDLG